MSQKYTILNSLFTNIADVIREKKGNNENIMADNFPDEIDSIENEKNIENFENAFMKKIVSTYENSRVTTIGDYAFYSCDSLTSVSFPQATIIGHRAFWYCIKLTLISFPQATTIGTYAFYCCSSLTSVNFPQTTGIESSAFYNCSSLTSVNFPQVTSIGQQAFGNCYSLASVSFPQAISIGSSAFWYCYSLTSINFPQTISIGSNAFQGCTRLASVVLGGWQSQIGMIHNYAFRNCYNLTDLHLQGSYLYTLSNSNAFNSTPIGGYSASAGKYGSIYVPASLYSQYISATNWTYFSSRFVSVSSSSGGNNDCGFTVSGNTLTITDNHKLNDGINPDECHNDYLIVGLSLDDDTYEDLMNSIINTGQSSINPQYLTSKLNNINNEGLSVCLTDGNNTYQILLDSLSITRIQLATIRDEMKIKRYIPVVNKRNLYNINEYNFNNNLNFYWVCYNYNNTSSCYDIVNCNLQENISEFDFNNYWEITYIDDISDDMFEYPLQDE